VRTFFQRSLFLLVHCVVRRLVRCLRTGKSQSFGHRALSLSREPDLSRRGHGIQTVFSHKSLQNGQNLPGPPLVKSGVSSSSPGTTPVIDPDCHSLAALSDSLRSSEPPRFILSSLRDQRPRGRSWQSASSPPTRLRTGHFPDPLSRARRIFFRRIFCYASYEVWKGKGVLYQRSNW